MKIDFLQIGFQKCGSTFMERNVYAYNEDIECLQAVNVLDLEREFLNSIILSDQLEFDENLARLNIYNIINSKFNFKNINGIMFEPLTFLYQRRFDRKNVIDRLKLLFPDAKIIHFIRRQDEWLISHYSEYIKGGGLLSLHDFIECQLNNKLLDSHYIDWHPLVSQLHKTFGEKNVLICLFEEIKTSPNDTANKIFNFLGAKTSKINSAKVNPSLTPLGLALHRVINHLIRYDCGTSHYGFSRDLNGAKPNIFSRLRHKFIYSCHKPILYRTLYKFDRLLNFKGKLKLEPDHIRKINDRYGENNKKLSELLKIDLESFGYPTINENSNDTETMSPTNPAAPQSSPNLD